MDFSTKKIKNFEVENQLKSRETIENITMLKI